MSETLAGTTTIADHIVAKVIGLAARGVVGVHSLGESSGRAFGPLRPGSGKRDYAHGVRVEVGAEEVAADLALVAEFDVPLQHLCDRVRQRVLTAVTDVVGLRASEVNVEVADVHLPARIEARGGRSGPAPVRADSEERGERE